MLSSADLQAIRDGIRRDAEAHLIDFIRAGAWNIVEPGRSFIGNWHIDAICEHLEAVGKGQIRNLLINMPPRCMKSLLVSVFWPAWEWTHRPDRRYLYSSYSQTLSTRDSLKCRRIIDSNWYQENWRDRFCLTGDQNQKTRFENDKTGYRIATSVGGSGTGEGGDVVITDDPHNALEAVSNAQRESALLWWDETMSTRLNDPKSGSKIIVMQRLHEKDLSGHVLEQGGYTHLCLPMRYEPDRRCVIDISGWADPREESGESLLWPERVPEEELIDLEKRLGAYGTAGQLQQRPAPRGGGMFKRHWFEVVKAAPAQAERRVRYWDLAATEAVQGKDPDWTVGLKMSMSKGVIYIEHVARLRGSPLDVERLIKSTAQADGLETPIIMEQEPGSSGKTLIAYFIREVLQGFSVRPDPPTGDKEVRAAPFASQAEAGNVRLVESATWNEDYLRILEVFPAGAHDDDVDATSGAYKALLAMSRRLVW